MKAVLIACKRVTIDKLMIQYMGRAVVFMQYMPRKPIKHGLKVFAVCCAYTAFLLAFEVYSGTNADDDNTALAVICCLLQKAYLLEVHGRTLYSNNWYTIVDLAKMLFNDYGCYFCGTMTPMEKQLVKTGMSHFTNFLWMLCNLWSAVGIGNLLLSRRQTSANHSMSNAQLGRKRSRFCICTLSTLVQALNTS